MTGILGAPRAWRHSSPTRWFVVFCQADQRHWWDWVFRTPQGFSHVYVLRWDGWNWLLFNPTTSFTDVGVVGAVDETQLWELVLPGATVLEVEAFRPMDVIRGRWWIGPMTCVEQVKALLGVPVGRIFTPWQLYQFLIEASNGQSSDANKAPDPIDQADVCGKVDHRRPHDQGGPRQRSMGKGKPGHFRVRRCSRTG